MIFSSRYRSAILVASVSTAFVLSACQPTNEAPKASTTEEVMPPPVAVPETDIVDTHTDYDMADDKTLINDAKMMDMLKDYTKSISDMHDEMKIGMAYNDPDTAFAKSMLGHHRGAVDMAKIELKYGNDRAMLELAQEITDTHRIEVNIMRKWLASHPDVPKPKPDTQAMQQAYAQGAEGAEGMDAMNIEMMLGIEDPVPDMAFARGMLPHHRSAVDMAKVQLKYGKDEEMRKLAQNIIDAQQPEIELMQNWINKAAVDVEKAETISINKETSADSTEAVESNKANKPNT